VIRFKELFLKQNNFYLFPLPKKYHVFAVVNAKTRALIRTKISKSIIKLCKILCENLFVFVFAEKDNSIFLESNVSFFSN